MVITTHMIHQMAKEKNSIPENPDSKIIESFLKNANELEAKQEINANS